MVMLRRMIRPMLRVVVNLFMMRVSVSTFMLTDLEFLLAPFEKFLMIGYIHNCMFIMLGFNFVMISMMLFPKVDIIVKTPAVVPKPFCYALVVARWMAPISKFLGIGKKTMPRISR